MSAGVIVTSPQAEQRGANDEAEVEQETCVFTWGEGAYGQLGECFLQHCSLRCNAFRFVA